MVDTVKVTLPLQRWQGDPSAYHLVTLTAAEAETVTTHAALHRLEYGARRGFGSVKVIARVGTSEWKSSLFPKNADDMGRKTKNWILLVSKKVMRAEDLAEGDPVRLELQLL